MSELKFTITGDSFDSEGFSLNNWDGSLSPVLGTIDWGDENTENYQNQQNGLYHSYEESGTYTITISGFDITQIGSYAFISTNITSVIIPNTVTDIGYGVFANCTDLESITFEGSTPPTVDGSNPYGEGTAFEELPSTCVIRVPTGSLSAYTSAENYPDSTEYTYVEYTSESSSQEEQGQSGDSPSPSSNPLSILYNHIKQLTKQWFYDKSEIDQKLLDKLDATDVPTALSDLTDDVGYLTEHQSLADIGGEVTVEKQQSAESGYAATYVVKQDSTQVGVKINIPKDFLVKSGEVKTAAAADLSTLGAGYTAGDKYIDFVINTKEGDGTDEHMYINVKDLVEDTTYQADGATLTLSNGTFSITAGGVDTTELADSAVTTAKINDGAVTADKIASAVKSTWLDTSDVDSEIEDYIDALTTSLTPSSGSGE